MKLKTALLTFFYFLLNLSFLWAQVTLSPVKPTADQEITIIYDASKGTGKLAGASKVYMHAGVVISGPGNTDWSNVIGNWGKDDGIGAMTKVDGQANQWQIKITPRSYFKIAAGVKVYRLAMVFRSADGSAEGKTTEGGDIFADLDAGFYVRFLNPSGKEAFTRLSQKYTVKAEAGKAADLSLSVDGQVVKTVTFATAIEADLTYTEKGQKTVKLSGKASAETAEESFSLTILDAGVTQERPAGTSDGITYLDDKSVRLSLYAPEKDFVYVVGDFNDWKIDPNYQMKKTPDGKRYWLDITNLTPKKEYLFQYLIDGTLKVTDPYSEIIADPYSDGSINYLIDEKTPFAVHPALPVYPTGKTTDLATVIQTAQTPYDWKIKNFQRPAKENLVVYELLIRDFSERHNFQTLIDSIPYFKRLGVNAIELMPIMEFENNNSWGYNVSHHAAVDKYYGHKNDLKRFIDKCHENGLAVILDMVLNHAFGQNPMVRMYWDKAKNIPAANSPWFNQQPTHPFNVGYDFNHESTATREYIDQVNTFWVKEYKFDGFRFDLSKGFTQTKSSDDGVFRRFDAGRIASLKRMADKIWQADATAYVILEHFAEDSEEIALSDYGMMLWGNMHGAYINGINYGGGGISRMSSKTRGWNKNHLVGYMESHDEERVMYKVLKEGSVEGNYDVKNLATACERTKATAAFLLLPPGPKMIWQFGEFGYDISIGSDMERLARKPLRWNYLQDANRLKLFKTYSEINKLKTNYEVFRNGTFDWNVDSQTRRMNFSHSSMNVTVVANFALSRQGVLPNFQKAGKWYDYFSGNEVSISDPKAELYLDAAEFHIFTDQKLPTPEAGIVPYNLTTILGIEDDQFSHDLQIYPNPAGESLNIRWTGAVQPKVEVFDLLGQKVMEQRGISTEIRLNTGTLSKGTYLLRLSDGSKRMSRKITIE
jgi:1,4-alpha-glucan branching enzyme